MMLRPAGLEPLAGAWLGGVPGLRRPPGYRPPAVPRRLPGLRQRGPPASQSRRLGDPLPPIPITRSFFTMSALTGPTGATMAVLMACRPPVANCVGSLPLSEPFGHSHPIADRHRITARLHHLVVIEGLTLDRACRQAAREAHVSLAAVRAVYRRCCEVAKRHPLSQDRLESIANRLAYRRHLRAGTSGAPA